MVSPGSLGVLLTTIFVSTIHSSPRIAGGVGFLALVAIPAVSTFWTMQKNPEATASELNLKVADKSSLVFGLVAAVEAVAVVGGIIYNKSQYKQWTRLENAKLDYLWEKNRGMRRRACKEARTLLEDSVKADVEASISTVANAKATRATGKKVDFNSISVDNFTTGGKYAVYKVPGVMASLLPPKLQSFYEGASERYGENPTRAAPCRVCHGRHVFPNNVKRCEEYGEDIAKLWQHNECVTRIERDKRSKKNLSIEKTVSLLRTDINALITSNKNIQEMNYKIAQQNLYFKDKGDTFSLRINEEYIKRNNKEIEETNNEIELMKAKCESITPQSLIEKQVRLEAISAEIKKLQREQILPVNKEKIGEIQARIKELCKELDKEKETPISEDMSM